MPALTIQVRLPLGVFQGHRGDGSSAPYPDTARLFSALMHAAGKGMTAVERNGDLRPSQASLDALTWLESHAPEAVTMPESVPCAAGGRTFAWRVEGVIDKGSDYKTQRRMSSGQAVNGVFAWHWSGVPDSVVEQVELLCPDVSCLGESDSPAVLEVGALEPTHRLDRSVSKLRRPRGGMAIRTPIVGRVEVLEDAYDQARPNKAPSVARDRSGSTLRPSPVPLAEVEELTYLPTQAAPAAELPWGEIHVLVADTPVMREEEVVWCVALHRALVRLMGDEAPGLVTGRYAEGVVLPANRLAIHHLSRQALQAAGVESDHGGFVVMVPQGADPAEVAQLDRALTRVRLYRGDAGELTAHWAARMDAGSFWAAPQPGWQRSWRPQNAFVPESRAQDDHPEMGSWTLVTAAELSVAHVFRASLPGADGGYWDRVHAVRERGVVVSDVHRIRDSHVGRYAHKVPKGLGVVQPYTAVIDLADLCPPTALVALGQSRHLGGGLLMPVDQIGEGL